MDILKVTRSHELYQVNVIYYFMSSNRKERLLTTAVRAARLGGEVILKSLGRISDGDVVLKEASDFVTRVDTESEGVIIRAIEEEFPDHSFLAEESAGSGLEDEGYLWIIDPLDGTTNYIHGYPAFSVSIAVRYKDEIVAGVVFDPVRDELFTAVQGQGASLNGRMIEVSDVADPGYALLATGFPFRKKEIIDDYLGLFRKLFMQVSDIRRGGSAAIDLAYIACGRCDGFFEVGLSPWDIAAGSLLIEEAGGRVTDFSGGHDSLLTGSIVAGNPYIQRCILRDVKDTFPGLNER